MRNVKHRLETFSFYDYTYIAKYLEKMAAKGWLLDKIGNFTWRYRRIAPAKLKFTVTYFPAATTFDPEPSEKQKTLWEFCEQDGWKLAAANAQMQVFYNEQEDPYPIETEAEIQLENIHQSAKKSVLVAHTMLLLAGILQMALTLGRFRDYPVSVLCDNSFLFAIVCWLSVIIQSLTEIIGYLWWHRKAVKTVGTDGSIPETHGHHLFQKIVLIFILTGLALWLFSFGKDRKLLIALMSMAYMIVMVFLINVIKAFLKRRNVSADVNRKVTVAACFVLAFVMTGVLSFSIMRGVQNGWFNAEEAETYEFEGHTFKAYHDELPFTIEEIRETGYDKYSYEAEEISSFLCSQLRARQNARVGDGNWGDLPAFTYTITEVKVPALYEFVRDEILNEHGRHKYDRQLGKRLEETDAAIWQAEEAYIYTSDEDVNDLGEYVLCYPKHIVEMQFYWKPTEEEIQRTAELIGKIVK